MIKIKSLLLMPILLLLLTTTSMAAGPTDQEELVSLIDGIIQAQMEEYGIAGATVSVVAGGNVVLSKGYGYADLDAQIAVDADRTLFRVGSISKLFVWTSVMQLVEQGKLDLDADINTYLDFEVPGVLLSGQPARPITLVDLMTHTAGFEDVADGAMVLSEDRLVPLDQYVRTHVPARVFLPGEVIAYSNYSSALGGYIVQRVSGLPFPQYVEEHIFAPLGMLNSTFRQPVEARLAGDLARGYRWIDDEVVEGDFVYALGPAGALSSTAGDLAKFMLAHLQGGALNGERILAEETAHMMQTRLFTPHPSIDSMAHGFVELTVNGRKTLFHPGSVFLFNSALHLLPDENVGLFVSYSGGNHLPTVELFQAFMDHYYPGTGQKHLTPVAGQADRARQFVGEYHVARRSYTTDASILTLLETVQVATDDEGYLVVTLYGEPNRFVEVGPGVYQNVRTDRGADPYGPFRTITFGQTSAGGTVLYSDGPMSYTKAPWYTTTGFTFASMILSALVVVGAPVYWLIRFAINRLRKREAQGPKLGTVARGVAAVYGLFAFLFLLGVLASGEMEPAFGVPKTYFGIEPAWTPIMSMLPTVMVVVGVGMLALTLVAWRKGYWRTWGRIHYTLVTAAAALFLTVLNIWNVV